MSKMNEIWCCLLEARKYEVSSCYRVKTLPYKMVFKNKDYKWSEEVIRTIKDRVCLKGEDNQIHLGKKTIDFIFSAGKLVTHGKSYIEKDDEGNHIKKKCWKCGETKSYNHFHKRKKNEKQLSVYCKPCKRLCQNESRNKRKEYYREKARLNYWKNPEKARESIRKRRDSNWHRNYYLQNKDKCYKACRDWAINNRHKMREYYSKRRLIEMKSESLFLMDKIDREEIYKKCIELTRETGIIHEVDHIIPLQGKNVCGLHVSWNLQIITQEQNRRKGNRV